MVGSAAREGADGEERQRQQRAGHQQYDEVHRYLRREGNSLRLPVAA
ncbi:MAG: hypothetical protein IT355_17090 [Gemmatimonadaceae bacterium]|nr:hypothetical protein [Gemmatimonadaceae bacterium]